MIPGSAASLMMGGGDITTSLTNRWTFNSIPFNDSVGGLNLTNSNATTAAAVISNGISTADSKYAYTSSMQNTIYAGSFSVALWLFANNTQAYTFSKPVSYGGYGYKGWTLNFTNTNNNLGFYFGSATAWGNSLNIVITKNAWHHVVFMCDANNIYAYLNGEYVSQTPRGSYANTTEQFKVGMGIVSTESFVGIIDELRIYSRTLNSNDINALYNYRG